MSNYCASDIIDEMYKEAGVLSFAGNGVKNIMASGGLKQLGLNAGRSALKGAAIGATTGAMNAPKDENGNTNRLQGALKGAGIGAGVGAIGSAGKTFFNNAKMGTNGPYFKGPNERIVRLSDDHYREVSAASIIDEMYKEAAVNSATRLALTTVGGTAAGAGMGAITGAALTKKDDEGKLSVAEMKRNALRGATIGGGFGTGIGAGIGAMNYRTGKEIANYKDIINQKDKIHAGTKEAYKRKLRENAATISDYREALRELGDRYDEISSRPRNGAFSILRDKIRSKINH